MLANDLKLRALEKTDLPFLHALFNDPAVICYWFEEPYLSMEELESRYQKDVHDSKHRQFILMDGEKQAGFVELTSIEFRHRNAEFTIMIDPNSQGQGYAKRATKLAMDYAFQTLNLHKLYLYVDMVNEKAMHIYEQVGFKKEAIIEEMFYVNGNYHDAMVMRLFDRDYQNLG